MTDWTSEDRAALEMLERDGWQVLWHPASGTFEASKGGKRVIGKAQSLVEVAQLLLRPSVPSLDVEACVRLLKEIAVWHRSEALPESSLLHFHQKVEAMASALASALPGMGKAFDRASHPMPRNVADHVRTMHDMKYEELSDDPYEDAEGPMSIGEKLERSLMTACTVLRYWIATGDIRHYRDVAARAAQPEETSADG